MPIPVITSVTPNVASPSGDMIVTIKGNGFRVPVLPTTENPIVFPSLTVYFGPIESPDVQVVDTETIIARVPPYIARWPAGTQPPPPPFFVSISVQNFNDLGVPITGELGTTGPNAFSYELPKHTDDNESDFAFLIRTLMRRMKNRLLVSEVAIAVSVDYDRDTGDTAHVVQFAQLPAIALVGPMLTENRFYSINEQPTFDGPDIDQNVDEAIDHVETRVPYTVDATFSMVVSTDDDIELLNLMANTIAFFHANKFLYLDRSQEDASEGAVRYEMDFTPNGEPRATTNPNKDNVRSFTAEFVIRGIDIECFSGFDAGSTYGVPNQAIINQGKLGSNITINEQPLPPGYAGNGFSVVLISRPGPQGDPGTPAPQPTGTGFVHVTGGQTDGAARLVNLTTDVQGSLPLGFLEAPTGTGFFHITNGVAGNVARAVDLSTSDVVGVLAKSHLPAVDLGTDVTNVLPLNRIGPFSGTGVLRIVNGIAQGAAGRIDLATDVDGILDFAHLALPPLATGTGFVHITSGAQDAAARAIDLSTADTTGQLALGRVAAPTGSGFARVTSGAWAAAAGPVDLASADVTGILSLAHLSLPAPPTGTGFTHISGGVQDGAARAVDLFSADAINFDAAFAAQLAATPIPLSGTSGVLPLARVGAPTGTGLVHVVGGVVQGAASAVDLSGADVSGVLGASHLPPMTVPATGTGFLHFVGGTQDAAARAVDLSGADVSNVLPLAKVGAPTGSGFARVVGGAFAAAAALIALASDVSGTLPLANQASPTGSGFVHVTAGAYDGAARSLDLSTTDTTGQLALARIAGDPAADGIVLSSGGTLYSQPIGGDVTSVDPGSGLYYVTTISGLFGITGDDWAFVETAALRWDGDISGGVIWQQPRSGTGPSAGKAFTVRAQQGQTQTGAVANTTGGKLILSSGLPGTGGSGAAGVAGSVQLWAGATQMSSIASISTDFLKVGTAAGVNITQTAITINGVALAITPTGTGIPHVVGGVMQAASSLVSLTTDVTGVLPSANMSAPTGSGFVHITGGARDAAARAIDLSTADTTGTLALARVASPTGTGLVHVVAGAIAAAATLVSLSADVTGSLPLANQASPTGSGFVHVTTGARDAAARAVDLSTGDVTGVLPIANQQVQTLAGDVTGTTATALVVAVRGIAISATAPTGAGQVLTSTGIGAAGWATPSGGGSSTYETLSPWLATSTPLYAQADLVTNGATGALTTIRAQNATGTTSTGGQLKLQSGTGTTAAGTLTAFVGTSQRLQLGTATGDYITLGPISGVTLTEAALTGAVRLPAATSGSSPIGAVMARRGLYALDVSLIKYVAGGSDNLQIGDGNCGPIRMQGAGNFSLITNGGLQLATTGGVFYRDTEFSGVSWALTGSSTTALSQAFTTTNTVTIKHADVTTAAWTGKLFLVQASNATGTGATVGAELRLASGTGATTGALTLYAGTTERFRAEGNGVSLIGGAGSYGAGVGAVFIANATTAPSTNPAGGGVLYVEGGALKYRGSAGTPTVLAAA